MTAKTSQVSDDVRKHFNNGTDIEPRMIPETTWLTLEWTYITMEVIDTQISQFWCLFLDSLIPVLHIREHILIAMQFNLNADDRILFGANVICKAGSKDFDSN